MALIDWLTERWFDHLGDLGLEQEVLGVLIQARFRIE
jgi:hypothetical protein